MRSAARDGAGARPEDGRPSPAAGTHVCGEPGAKSLADDLILGRGFVRSRAAPSLRSIESYPSIQAFVGPAARGRHGAKPDVKTNTFFSRARVVPGARRPWGCWLSVWDLGEISERDGVPGARRGTWKKFQSEMEYQGPAVGLKRNFRVRWSTRGPPWDLEEISE